jgi:predicted phosphodiesterase
MNKKIIITGDIHGYWGHLNTLINKKNPDILIICGDFGYWPHFHKNKDFHKKGVSWDQYGIKNPNTDIYWIDGNHENHEAIASMIADHGRNNPIKMDKFINGNVYYMPRCTTMTMNDINCLFIGGAVSIDKSSRVEGISWWRNEELSYSDYLNLPNENLEVVFSHTVPSFAFDKMPEITQFLSAKFQDSSCKILEEVFYNYKPKQWYFGHFHKEYHFNFEGCEFTGLDMANGYGKWWTKF